MYIYIYIYKSGAFWRLWWFEQQRMLQAFPGPWPWLSTFQEWASLAMAFLGKFAYMNIIHIILSDSLNVLCQC